MNSEIEEQMKQTIDKLRARVKELESPVPTTRTVTHEPDCSCPLCVMRRELEEEKSFHQLTTHVLSETEQRRKELEGQVAAVVPKEDVEQLLEAIAALPKCKSRMCEDKVWSCLHCKLHDEFDAFNAKHPKP